jgi:UDP-3-O-[3-hydroxymyristoyl] glucosamine N-acyltransferase
MAKRRFFDRPSGLTVAEIVSLTGARSDDGARLSHLITDVAPIDLAGPADLTFIESNKIRRCAGDDACWRLPDAATLRRPDA